MSKAWTLDPDRLFDPDPSWKKVAGEESTLPTLSDLGLPNDRFLLPQ